MAMPHSRKLALLLIVAAFATRAAAQPILDVRENLAFDRPEAWAMKWVASVNLTTGLGAPAAKTPGSIDVGLEAVWVPSLSDRQATVGFNGIKKEEINRSSILGRPRVVFALPAGWSLELSYLPPLFEIDGIEPDLFAAAVERPLYATRSLRLGGRLAAQRGTLEGDITCSEGDVAGGSDLILNPFQCESPSRDELTLRSASLQLLAAAPVGSTGRWEPYVGLAANYLDLEFQVDARYSGIVDITNERTSGWTWSVTAGVAYRASERLRFVTEIFYSPLDVVRPPSTSPSHDDLLNARTFLAYRLRSRRGS